MLKLGHGETISRRLDPRKECNEPIDITTADRKFTGFIENISTGGASIKLNSAVTVNIGQSVMIFSKKMKNTTAIVKWTSMAKFGVVFEKSITNKDILEITSSG